MSRAVLLPVLLILLIVPGLVFGATVSSLTITVYKDGEALQDATVELWLNNTLMYRGVTDTNGTITLANVTTGSYTVYVYYNGTVWKFEETIDENTTSITLNITNDTVEYLIGLSSPPFWGKVENYYGQYRIPILVGVGFIVLILLAYALSGTRYPRRRR
ncbi:MAG: carboxypeptidase regulatory-like domain-containing protein [Staphylothermus sp.]|nr:carboxypeptidase regulatory-like domain-containing protein [Staphylothermus sp.]